MNLRSLKNVKLIISASERFIQFYCLLIVIIGLLITNASLTCFRQVGSGEIPLDEEEWENESETDYRDGFCNIVSCSPETVHPETIVDVPRRRSSLLCDVYGVNVNR